MPNQIIGNKGGFPQNPELVPDLVNAHLICRLTVKRAELLNLLKSPDLNRDNGQGSFMQGLAETISESTHSDPNRSPRKPCNNKYSGVAHFIHMDV